MGDGKTPTSYDYNVSVTRNVVALAHACGVSVEGTIDVIRFLKIKEDDHESNIVIAKYKFVEDKTKKYAGVFEGYLLTNINCTDGGAEYNDERLGGDGFSNNQYIGTWTSNTTKIIKTANWGDYRIPNSNDLDAGCVLSLCQFA